jgi:hypothetical protein
MIQIKIAGISVIFHFTKLRLSYLQRFMSCLHKTKCLFLISTARYVRIFAFFFKVVVWKVVEESNCDINLNADILSENEAHLLNLKERVLKIFSGYSE